MYRKRPLQVVVLSDLHLGMAGCQAAELADYLRSIAPEKVILNGDVIDFWQFRKGFFPPAHFEVITELLKMAASGIKIYYLTGNHDDALRKFGEHKLGPIDLCDHLVFWLNGKKHWVFHGDIFDGSVKKARWLAKLGGDGYEFLIRINRLVNRGRVFFGLSNVSFAAKTKQLVKRKAAKMVGDFEKIAIELAEKEGFDVVICGHIHRPTMRQEGQVLYMNSGDWVENCTALECANGKWSLFRHEAERLDLVNPKLHVPQKELVEFPTVSIFDQVEQRLAAFRTGPRLDF